MSVQAPPDLMDPEFVSDPYPIYRTWRDEFPLIWHEGIQAYIISRYEDVDKAFREFSSENYAWQMEPIIGRSILQLEGREHAKHRALVAPAFRGKELEEKFHPVIRKNAEELLDGFRADGQVDLAAQFTTRFPIGVIVDMLALPRADHESFKVWYSVIMDFLSNVAQDPEVHAAGMRTTEELRTYMAPIIRERRERPGDDVLSNLCKAEIDGEQMTEPEINAFIGLLLNAGGETSDKAMASMFKNLVSNPEQLRAVQEDRSLIVRAFAETLRYTPPVRIIMRTTREDTELSGGTLEGGKTVACMIGAANTDDRRFEDADSFDIFREDLEVKKAFSGAANHVAFCAGRHFCVGAQLAKAEIEIGTNLLLDAMPDLRFPDGYVPEDVGLFTRAPAELKLEFTPGGLSMATPSFQLDGMTVIVTGAGSGIGQRLATGVAEFGAAVGCFDLAEEGCAETAAAIGEAGGKALAVTVDVTDAAALGAAVAKVGEELGPLRGAINCAGIHNTAPAEEMPAETWRALIDTNLTGVFNSCVAEAKAMFEAGGGSIVNIGSISGTIANRGLQQAHYNSAKAGVAHLTRSLALEWAPRNVRVNTLSPGYTATPMAKHPDVWEHVKHYVDDIPLGRMAETDELVGPAVFLLSGASSYCTAAELPVDGGACAW